MVEFSLIIPHYNRPELLKRLLSTIPDTKQIEVLIIDDRSDLFKDQYSAVVKEYNSDNIFFISNHSPFKGAGASRNIGIKEARGKWIMFIDSDDYLLGDFYETVKSYIKSENDIIHFKVNMSIFSNTINSRTIPKRNQYIDNYNNGIDNNALMLKYMMVSSVASLYRRQFLLDNQIYFSEVLNGEDKLFRAKAAFYSKSMTASSKIIYMIEPSSNSLSKNKSKSHILAVLNEDIKKYQFLYTNLAYKDFKALSFSFRHILYDSFSHHGLFFLFKCIRILRYNKVKWFEFKFLNPIFLVSRIYHHNRLV